LLDDLTILGVERLSTTPNIELQASP
jgi:hypothetical protein